MTKKIIKAITIVSYVILIAAAIYFVRDMDVDDLLNYTPENKFVAALFLLGLFALKSISIVFPIIVLQITVGMLFPAPIALAINLIGTAIGFTVPYYVGMFLGADMAEQQIQKNEKLRRIIERQQQREFFLAFFLRVISCLPSDLVSMYLGLLRFKFPKYILSSILGALPGIIPATLMGKSIRDPLSPQFISAISITLICSVISIVFYYYYTKKHVDD